MTEIQEQEKLPLFLSFISSLCVASVVTVFLVFASMFIISPEDFSWSYAGLFYVGFMFLFMCCLSGRPWRWHKLESTRYQLRGYPGPGP